MSRRLLALILVAVVALAALQLPGRGALSTVRAAADEGDWPAAERALPKPGLLRLSANTLHDAGVVAWRQDDPATALADWRAAAERAPRDPRVQRALSKARAAFDTRPRPVADAPDWTAALSPDELAVLVLALWIAASAAALSARRRGTTPWPPVALAVLALALGGVWWQGARVLARPVVVPTTDVAGRLLPEAGTEVRITWPPGTELRVQDRRGPFVRVVDGGGTTAWIDATTVAWPRGATPEGLDAP